MHNTKQPVLRRIKSFVKREGRLTPGQATALTTGWPIFGLDSNTALSPSSVFNNDNPITLEIGFGNGASLAEMAEASPDKNFIGIEVHQPGVGHLLRLIQEKGLDNIRVFDCDAIDVLNKALPNNSLDCIQLFFPDPWHKKRHHKRRIVQTEFLNLVHDKLNANGVLHIATDWENYAEHILDTLNEHKNFENVATTNFIDRPEHRPLTKFEQRGQRLGHGVWDIMFKVTKTIT